MDNGSRKLENSDLIAEARTSYNAFASLYRRHYDALFRYCVHRLFDRQAAEDVTSAVFLKMVENFGRFRGSERDFRNWLYKIATNEINSHLRKTARRKAVLLKIVREQSNSKNATGEDSSAKLALLKQAILTLRPRYQTIIALRFFENLKLTEIAEVLASSPGTVRSQLKRALDKLRKKIDTIRKEV